MEAFFRGVLVALLLLALVWSKVAPAFIMPRWMFILLCLLGGIVGVVSYTLLIVAISTFTAAKCRLTE